MRNIAKFSLANIVGVTLSEVFLFYFFIIFLLLYYVDNKDLFKKNLLMIRVVIFFLCIFNYSDGSFI
jgi:hypothetical protein